MTVEQQLLHDFVIWATGARVLLREDVEDLSDNDLPCGRHEARLEELEVLFKRKDALKQE
jgi:hypothetical protein